MGDAEEMWAVVDLYGCVYETGTKTLQRRVSSVLRQICWEKGVQSKSF